MANENKNPKSNIVRPKSTKGISEEQLDDFLAFRENLYKGESKDISKGEEMLLKAQKLEGPREKLLRDLYNLKQQEKSDRTVKQEGVIIAEYSDKALKQMGIVKTPVGGVSDGYKQDSGFLGALIKLAVPLLMTGGAFLASINQMFKGGPLQGIMNIISKGFAVLFNTLLKGLPKIPFISTIFAKGGFVRNILAKIFGKGSIITKIFGKTGSNIGLNLFKGVGKVFLKRLPIIGSLISLGSAVKRIKDGDYIGGLLDLGAATAYMFPGIGTAIGIALDLINAGKDIYTNNPEAVNKKITNVKKVFGDFFTYLVNKVSDLMEMSIQWMVDQLYKTVIPAGMINSALDMMGLPSFKKNETDIELIKNEKRSEKIRQNIAEQQTEISLGDLRTGLFNRKLRTDKVRELENELKEIEVETKQLRMRQKNEQFLIQREKNEQYDILKGHTDALNENTRKLEESTQASANIGVSNTNSSNVNNFNYNSGGITQQRKWSRGMSGNFLTPMGA